MSISIYIDIEDTHICTWQNQYVSFVFWLVWWGDTGNGLCAEQTQRLTVAEARETTLSPSSRMEKMYVCVLCLGYNFLNSRHHRKSAVAFYNLILRPQINSRFSTWQRAFRDSVSARKLTYTPGKPSCLKHTHNQSCWVYRMTCLLVFPLLLWFVFQVLILRGCGLVGGVCVGGDQGLLEEQRERGPILEELLSGGGGQPKGRILVLESGRGEEGWNHVSFIHPPPPPPPPPTHTPSSSPDWESINSFNPVFLWIRLAFWATAALFSYHSPRGVGGGLHSTVSEAVNDNILERNKEPNNDINKSERKGRPTKGQDISGLG